VQVLVSESSPAHQSIVGIEDHVHSTIVILPERMFLIRFDRVGLHVARETDLERDPAIVHVLRQRFVFVKPCRVPDAIRATDMHGLADV
jgi:hypothetical protein